MSNIIEDGINFGMGLFAYSREKIEEMVEKMVAKGEVQREELSRMVKGEVRETLQDIGLTADTRVTKDDIREIIREEIAAAKVQDK